MILRFACLLGLGNKQGILDESDMRLVLSMLDVVGEGVAFGTSLGCNESSQKDGLVSAGPKGTLVSCSKDGECSAFRTNTRSQLGVVRKWQGFSASNWLRRLEMRCSS